jgi:uncharacterized membrane protein YjgN (DUF898 family)
MLAPELGAENELMQSVRHPVVFTGEAHTYRPLWRRNVLLLCLTLGLSFPWALTSKLRYLYGHTQVAGHALGYHAKPLPMFLGNLVGMVLLNALYYGIAQMGAYAWMGVAALQLLMAAALPFMLHGFLSFQLMHTSWRGQRLHLAAGHGDAWRAMALPTLLYIASGVMAVWAVVMLQANHRELAWLYGSLAVTGFCVGLPLLYVQFKRYQHRHAAWGSVRNQRELDLSHGQSLGLSVKVGLLAWLACVLLVLPLTWLLVDWTGWELRDLLGRTGTDGVAGLNMALVLLPGVFMGLAWMMALPYPYLGASLQNRLWSSTAHEALRFESEVPMRALMRLSARNWLWVVLTLGWYYPVAAIAEARLRLQSVAVWVRPDLLGDDSATDATKSPA